MLATLRNASGTKPAVRLQRGVLQTIGMISASAWVPAFAAIIRRRAALFLGLAAVLILAASSASARELRIHSFNVELDVLPDSTLTVTETIGVEFIGSWNGIYRTIPVEYAGPGGFNYTLNISDVNATDSDGASLRIEKTRQGSNLQFKIYVPGASDATRSITVHYVVRNGLRFFDDHDELYWNVTGTDWNVPLEDVTAHITLPQGVTGLHATEFTGVYGSRAHDAAVEILGSNVDVHTLHPLEFHEGLTVVLGWDKGFVHAPTSSEEVTQFLSSNWPLFAPGLAFLAMFWLWFTRGRDPVEGAVTVQYAPPPGLSPGELGALVDETACMRDITATIVDLAVRGFLTIEERESKHLMGLYSNKEYVFHRTKPLAEWAAAKPHEMLLLSGIFSGGRDEVALSELQNNFYQNLPGIRGALFDSLVDHGYYAHRPDQVRQAYLAGGVVAGVLLFATGQYAAQKLGMQPLPFIVAAILTAAVICGFGWFMPARTPDGARARLNALGFEDFLGHVEADHMERIPQTPATFEKFLPFAMALGVEKKWVGAFQGICTQPPAWYQGPVGAPFFALGFVNSLDMMSARAGQVLASAPRSSSGGSGFGGGGFGGGGFGGGGGGGF